MGLEFRILGPLEALVDGVPVTVGGPRQRAVLASLIVRAGEVVPATRLIDDAWGDEPPETAANLVQGCISQLRKALGRDAILTRASGYSVVLDDDALDLARFERHAAAGVRAMRAGDATTAGAELRAGLSLWRGAALADLAAEPFARPIAARLEELRLTTLERALEADLACSREAEVAAELEPLIAEHPLRERLRGLQMLALYRAGRQADALAAFRAARAVLVEELGIEPGEELASLERAILRHDPDLILDPGASRDVDRTVPVRRAVVAAALSPERLAGLAATGASLARGPGGELVLAATVTDADELAGMTARLRQDAEQIGSSDLACRVAAFTSASPGADLARLAAEQDADLLLVDAPDDLLADSRIVELLDRTPCDVAVAVGLEAARSGPVLVPFSGAEHDWAAVELGAWLARATGAPLQLAGASTGPAGRDASRLLASASLAVQRALGLAAEPVIVEPRPQALVAAASGAGRVVCGLTDRWRREGLGPARTALARTSGLTTILVRRGLRPGGLAGPDGHTRFTWTIVPAPTESS